MVSYEQIKEDAEIRCYIDQADQSLKALGYTEHSFAHVTKTAVTAAHILKTLGYPERDAELAKIAGYMHDIGNLVNRVNHAQSGALMAYRLLDRLGMEPKEIAVVVSAIGSHDESAAAVVNPIGAALILADKTDVRRSRVRNFDEAAFDIHDRVNYSVEQSEVVIQPDHTALSLLLTIDTTHCAVMDYFEIFLQRMLLCRKAAQSLGMRFELVINGQRLL